MGIAESDKESWRLLTSAIPEMGRYSLDPGVREKMMTKFGFYNIDITKDEQTFKDIIKLIANGFVVDRVLYQGVEYRQNDRDDDYDPPSVIPDNPDEVEYIIDNRSDEAMRDFDYDIQGGWRSPLSPSIFKIIDIINGGNKKSIMLTGFDKMVIVNDVGINDDSRGSDNSKLQLQFYPRQEIDGPIRFEDMVQIFYRLKSHKFDNNYEMYISIEWSLHHDGGKKILEVSVDFDHGS